MDSSKPVPTPKKISNKRVKRKHSDIDEDTTDPSKNYSMSDDGYKSDSESSNISETVLANVNKDETDTETFEEKENSEGGDKNSTQPLIIDEKKETKEKQDDDEKKRRKVADDYISARCVNDRKLFMNCVNGDIEKYKTNVKLELSNQQTVWVGVAARPTFYYYICTKNSDGTMTTLFIDHNEKIQFDTAIKS